MSLLPRCDTCNRRIWPWQRMGWIMVQGTIVNWHAGCRRPDWSR